MTTAITSPHSLVIPGQVIASASQQDDDESDGGGFLRGHGTYVEIANDQKRLVASVSGTVERVNKLISVIPVASRQYVGHVGDLVVGRISFLTNNRWRIRLNAREAHLPLSGVFLPGGAQRLKTAEDARDMRRIFKEGDLVSAEVHNVHQDGTLVLHTRSMRYGKLENGCLVTVPPALIPRLRNHFVTMLGMDVVWGTNGYIWIQRSLPEEVQDGDAPLTETMETRRRQHAEMPVMKDERLAIARMRNAMESLRLVHSMVSPESVESVYQESLKQNVSVKDMLRPDIVIQLTECCRAK